MTVNKDLLLSLKDDQLAKQAIKLKEFLNNIDFEVVAPATAELKEIESILLERFHKVGLKVKEYDGVRILRSESTKFQLPKEHEDVFYKWLLTTFTGTDSMKMFSFFNNTVSQRAITEYVKDMDMTPPGLKTNIVEKITITPQKVEA